VIVFGGFSDISGILNSVKDRKWFISVKSMFRKSENLQSSSSAFNLEATISRCSFKVKHRVDLLRS